MTRNGIAACVAALALSVLSGCGTVSNLEHGCAPDAYRPLPSVYGGVQTDALVEVVSVNKVREQPILGFVDIGLFAADLPLSLVGDTATLPYVLYVHMRKQPENEKTDGDIE